MAKFGWCMHNAHNKCTGEFQQFYIMHGRVVRTDVIIECDCTCHERKD